MPDRYGDHDDWRPHPRVASTADDYDPTPEELAVFVADAKAALAIGCRYCHAQPDQPCFNDITDDVIRKFVHTIRYTDAHTPRVPLDTTRDDEELF